MLLRPLYEKIVVQRIDAPSTTPGGLIIPENSKKKSTKGKVVAVGEGRFLQDGTRALFPLTVKVGDQVVFAEYAGVDVEIGSEKFTILSENEVLAIVMEQENAKS